MNINRHNYEDYFMLYLDNELNKAERKAVEDFLLMNPDLNGEMDALKMTILLPDHNLVFECKEELMVSESNFINQHNYESFLVQYVDEVLTPEQTSALESFLASNPSAQHELNLFTKTKSVPDNTIVFSDKSSLYRHEKVHRVYSMRWMKQAAAAAIILAVGTGVFMLADNNSDTVITATEPVKQMPNQVIEKSTTSGGINENEPARSEYADNQKPVLKEAIENRQPSVQYAAIPQSNKKEQKNLSGNVTVKESNDFKKPLDIPVRLNDITVADENVYAKLQQQNINEEVVTNNLPVRTTIEASPETVQPMYVVNVADVEQDNKKIRGFFRKATRIFERTTNIAAANEDDKLLVGGFAINLK